jgi:hypothetical protein
MLQYCETKEMTAKVRRESEKERQGERREKITS